MFSFPILARRAFVVLHERRTRTVFILLAALFIDNCPQPIPCGAVFHTVGRMQRNSRVRGAPAQCAPHTRGVREGARNPGCFPAQQPHNPQSDRRPVRGALRDPFRIGRPDARKARHAFAISYRANSHAIDWFRSIVAPQRGTFQRFVCGHMRLAGYNYAGSRMITTMAVRSWN